MGLQFSEEDAFGDQVAQLAFFASSDVRAAIYDAARFLGFDGTDARIMAAVLTARTLWSTYDFHDLEWRFNKALQVDLSLSRGRFYELVADRSSARARRALDVDGEAS